METMREIIDFYIPKLIMKMSDPNPAIQYCETFNPPDTLMKDITKNVPDLFIKELWNRVVRSTFKEDPHPLLKEMEAKMMELKAKGQV